MPNKHAAIKDLRKSAKHAERNNRLKTHVKALTKQLTGLMKDGKKDEAKELGKKLQQAIAKGAKNSVFHANKASRKISALHLAFNKETSTK